MHVGYATAHFPAAEWAQDGSIDGEGTVWGGSASKVLVGRAALVGQLADVSYWAQVSVGSLNNGVFAAPVKLVARTGNKLKSSLLDSRRRGLLLCGLRNLDARGVDSSGAEGGPRRPRDDHRHSRRFADVPRRCAARGAV